MGDVFVCYGYDVTTTTISLEDKYRRTWVMYLCAMGMMLRQQLLVVKISEGQNG